MWQLACNRVHIFNAKRLQGKNIQNILSFSSDDSLLPRQTLFLRQATKVYVRNVKNAFRNMATLNLHKHENHKMLKAVEIMAYFNALLIL